MTNKSQSKQSTMFDALAKKSDRRASSNKSDSSIVEIASDLKTKQQEPFSEPSTSTSPRKGRAKTGKRSDPRYTQVGCYIPRDLNTKIKMKLVDDPRDFSDLVAELLNSWLSE